MKKESESVVIRKIIEEQIRLKPGDHTGQKKILEKIKKIREEEKKGRT